MPNDGSKGGRGLRWLRHATSTASSIRGGLVGRIAWVLVVAITGVTVISVAFEEIWLAAAGLAIIVLMFLLSVPRLIRLAEKSPNAALMEGSELLMFEQIQAGMKSQPLLSVDPNDVDPTRPLLTDPPEQLDELVEE